MQTINLFFATGNSSKRHLRLACFKRAREKPGTPATELRFCSVKNRGEQVGHGQVAFVGGPAITGTNGERGSKREGQPDKKHSRRRE